MSLDVVVRVQSSYYERTSSSYRLAMSENTLITSLKHQNDKRFKVVLELCPLDPCYTLRRLAFDKIGVSVELEEQAVLQRRLEIRIGDDNFAHPDLVGAIQIPSEKEVNTRLYFPSGYIFHEGELYPWLDKEDQIEVVQYVDESSDQIRQSITASRSCSWLTVRHGMNRSVLKEPPSGKEITRLNWAGWKPAIVERYCKTQMIESTAQGCELYPLRSKSVVFALNSARRRKK